MEMPEGWKRLMHQTEEMREGARLMKEMAEALHNISVSDSEDLTDKSLAGFLYKFYAKEMLNKFREWK